MRFRILVKSDDLALYTIHWIYLFFDFYGDHFRCSDNWCGYSRNGWPQLKPWRAIAHLLMVPTLEMRNPVRLRTLVKVDDLAFKPPHCTLRFRTSSEPVAQRAERMVRARDAHHGAVGDQSQGEANPLGTRLGRSLKGE